MSARLLLPIIALCCAVMVANIYLGQPLLTLISEGLNVSPADAGWVATVGQLGYGLGLLLILPLGDAVRKRPLLVVLTAGTAGSLLLASGASNLAVLLGAVLAASALTIVPQLLIPLAAAMAPPEKRAQVVGTAFGGLMAGIVLSRTVGGMIGEHAGWRTVYVWAAIATVVIGLITIAVLPSERPRGAVRYLELLRSLGTLLRTERVLQQSVLMQSLVFSTFSLFWTTLVLLFTGGPYHFDVGTAGLFGLVGLVGVVIAPLAGRISDRIGPLTAVGMGAGAVLVSAILFTFGQVALPFAIAGIATLLAGVPTAQVANQSRVLASRPEAANRMNTVYLVLNFVASTVGAALAGVLYGNFGWGGVSVGGLVLSTLGVLAWASVWFASSRRARATCETILEPRPDAVS